MTGPRFHNDFEKTYTLDFGFGVFAIQGRWGYDFGFMVPVKATATLSPTAVSSARSGQTVSGDLKVKVSVTDQSGSYYSAAGMSGMSHGQEIPMQAYAEVRCKLEVFSKWIFS